MAITYRLVKGSKLTAAEGDENFRYLDDRAESVSFQLEQQRLRIDTIFLKTYDIVIDQSMFADLDTPRIITYNDLGVNAGHGLKMHAHLTEVIVEPNGTQITPTFDNLYIEDEIQGTQYVQLELSVVSGYTVQKRFYLPTPPVNTAIQLITENGIKFYSENPITGGNVNSKFTVRIFYQLASVFND